MSGETSSGALVDLLFMQDTTGSMGPYIQSAKESVLEVCRLLQESGRIHKQGGLRVGLIAYRDYPPEARAYVTKPSPFTDDINEVQNHLNGLMAGEGGDCEAFCSALRDAYYMKGWRKGAIKVIVIITDAPPHGIGEPKDSVKGIAPDGYSVEDPLKIARRMAKQEFIIMSLACEPTLSKYIYGVDFYKSLSIITSGALYPLTKPKLLASCIIGSVLESVDVQKLSLEYQEEIAHRFFVKKDSVGQIVKDINKLMSSAGQTAIAVSTENIYKISPESKHNIRIFLNSKSIGEAAKELQKIQGGRFTPEYKKSLELPKDKTPIATVTFKNTGEGHIKLEYYEAKDENSAKKVLVRANHMLMLNFLLNTTMYITLTKGRFHKNTSCTFTSDTDFDVETKFESLS